MLFASAGYKVVIYDKDPKISESALVNIQEQLQKLEKEDLLRGNLPAAEQFKLISATTALSDCVKDSVHVQVVMLHCSLNIQLNCLE